MTPRGRATVTQPTAGQKPETQEITQRLTAMIDYVRDCERRVNQGEIMDLDGLDKNVLNLCDGLGAIPHEDAKRLEPQMSDLIHDLEKLANAMRAMQKKIETEGG
jgi:hypothetical protein